MCNPRIGATAGHFSWAEVPKYVISQVLGGIGGFDYRSGDDGVLSDHQFGRHWERRSSGLCTNRNRLGSNSDPLDLNSRDQHISQSSAINCRGDFRGRIDPQVFAQQRGMI